MRMTATVASIIAASAAFVAGLAAVIALAFPQSTISPLSGLGQVREARAHALIGAPDASPAALEQALIETRASLRQSPANPTAWLRLAYIDSADGDGLGPAGNLALARSWAVAPLGPDDTPWRLLFAFNHWGTLDPSNRQLALDELDWSMSHGHLRNRSNLQALQTGVTDPSGRLALSLMTRLRPAPRSRDTV
jgi:hypothetical protein